MSSIDGNTGAFTTARGIEVSGNAIRLKLDSATLEAAPSDPANTASTTGAMMGLGTTCTITPVYSSRVKVELRGRISNNTSGNSMSYNARYGTGTAPSQGASVTGTLVGAGMVLGPNASAGQIWPISTGGIITGLTPGVAIWIDMVYATSANTLSANNIKCSAMEF